MRTVIYIGEEGGFFRDSTIPVLYQWDEPEGAHVRIVIDAEVPNEPTRPELGSNSRVVSWTATAEISNADDLPDWLKQRVKDLCAWSEDWSKAYSQEKIPFDYKGTQTPQQKQRRIGDAVKLILGRTNHKTLRQEATRRLIDRIAKAVDKERADALTAFDAWLIEPGPEALDQIDERANVDLLKDQIASLRTQLKAANKRLRDKRRAALIEIARTIAEDNHVSEIFSKRLDEAATEEHSILPGNRFSRAPLFD